MDQNPVKIADVITTEYDDFLSYCVAAGKVYTSELTNADYVAFRTSFGQSREYIKAIKSKIENLGVITSNLPNGIDSLTVVTESELNMLPKEEDVNQLYEKIVFNSKTIIDSASDAAVAEKNILISPEVAYSARENLTEKMMDNNSSFEQEETLKINISCSTQHSLAYLLGVNESEFSGISVEQLCLSVRASNCLKSAKCVSLKDILCKSVVDLQNIPNMGTRSVNEVIQKVKKLVFNSGKMNMIANNLDNLLSSHSFLNDPTDSELQAPVRAFLLGEKYTTEGMTDIQVEKFEKFKAAAAIIGEEICLAAYLNPQYSNQICNMLLAFAIPHIQYKKMREETINKISLLDNSIRKRKAIPFIQAYEVKAGTKLSYLLSECKENTIISRIPYLYETFRKEENMFTLLTEINETNKFLAWLNFDVKKLIASISEDIQSSLSRRNKRSIEVFSLRSDGKTLEEIGGRYGITRERVRQIELKVYKTVWVAYSKQKYDLIMLIYALRDGDAVLYFKELKELLGGLADILWACIKHDPDQKFYFYSKKLDAIVVRSTESLNMDEAYLLSKINEAIATLPELIKEEQKRDLLLVLSNENALPLEILEKEFEDTYKLSGAFYHKGYLSIVTICSYVLKHRFPAGFKIADEFEANRFRQHILEFFGEKGASITNRALYAKIGEVGILCDRGKYIHPDYIQIDQSIIDAVNDYVENSPRSLLLYSEIFEAMKDIFEGTQITNRYLLQGVLKKYGCRFSTGRDFVRKTQAVTFVDELEAFVEERGIVHKAEICAEFTSIGEAGLGQVVARSNNVFNIDNGYYIHASQFDIQPEDYEQLREYLKTACQDIPINIRSVQDAIVRKFPKFMYRNDFEDKNKLFAALNYMFGSEFIFSRPYIAKLGINEISNRSVIFQHIEKYDRIGIEELINICEDNNINYVTASYLFQMLAPEYIRIDELTLMKREYTGITDEAITKAVEIILEMLKTNDYIVGSKIKDFLWFPEVNINWNEFLLENLIIQSKKINIVYLIGDPLKHSNVVYVSDKYQKDTFNSLLLKVLTDEVQKGSFKSKVEMREWLKAEGFIERKLPNFLESAKYFYVNETGVHCTKE